MSEFERIVKFNPAWDRRTDNPSTNCGVHGVDMYMVLKGKLGAVQFLLYTNWQLPHVAEWHKSSFPSHDRGPMPADLGYHSPKPMYEDQTCLFDSCDYLDGEPCYYDGSTLNAERIYKILLEKGSDGVWKALEEYYNETFMSEAVNG